MGYDELLDADSGTSISIELMTLLFFTNSIVYNSLQSDFFSPNWEMSITATRFSKVPLLRLFGRAENLPQLPQRKRPGPGVGVQNHLLEPGLCGLVRRRSAYA